MKISFEKDINGFQNARKLKMILEHYAHSDISDKTTQLFIESLLQELEQFLSQPEFRSFGSSSSTDSQLLIATPSANTFSGKFINLWRGLFGPSKREQLLSHQRHELIERAERAEAIAFEALAETAEVGRQRDEALKKSKES